MLLAGACAPEPAPATLDCATAIDALDALPADYTPVLDAVAFDGSANAPGPVSTSEHGRDLFAKTGLLVRSGVASRVEVPADLQPGLSVGWGNADRTWELTVPACADDAPWLAFAGGYTLDEARCAELVVRVGDRDERVWVAVGRACAAGAQ